MYGTGSLYRASDISRGRGPAKSRYFREIPKKTQNTTKSARNISKYMSTWLFVGEVSPWNFPWNRPIFLRICPRKSFENWLFSAKIPRNGLIFRRILTFLPRKSPEIGWLFREFWLFPVKMPRNQSIFPRICPWKSREILLFSAKYHDVPWLLKWILFFHFKLANFNQVPVHKSKIRSDSYWSGKSWTIRHFTLFHLAVPEFPDMSGQIPVCPRHHFELWRERLELIIIISVQAKVITHQNSTEHTQHYKSEISNVWNDCWLSKKSGMLQENGNVPSIWVGV